METGSKVLEEMAKEESARESAIKHKAIKAAIRKDVVWLITYMALTVSFMLAAIPFSFVIGIWVRAVVKAFMFGFRN